MTPENLRGSEPRIGLEYETIQGTPLRNNCEIIGLRILLEKRRKRSAGKMQKKRVVSKLEHERVKRIRSDAWRVRIEGGKKKPRNARLEAPKDW